MTAFMLGVLNAPSGAVPGLRIGDGHPRAIAVTIPVVFDRFLRSRLAELDGTHGPAASVLINQSVSAGRHTVSVGEELGDHVGVGWPVKSSASETHDCRRAEDFDTDHPDGVLSRREKNTS